MYKAIVFAGTTEGYEICRFLSENKISALACVATEYGSHSLEAGADLSAFQQFFGYPKKRNLNTGHIAVRTGRSGIQYQNRKNNDGLSDSGGHRHFYFCMQYPDTGTGRYGRRMASYGTGMYDANGKLHSDGLHWNAACGGMFRYPVAGVSKE